MVPFLMLRSQPFRAELQKKSRNLSGSRKWLRGPADSPPEADELINPYGTHSGTQIKHYGCRRHACL